MSNPKAIQKFYLKIWSWPEDIKSTIGEIGDLLQYILPISFLVYCLCIYGKDCAIIYAGFFLACVGTSTLMKALFANMRPREWDDITDHPEISPDMNFDWSPLKFQSFTSSHSASGMAGALPWFLVSPWLGIIATLLAMIVGFSRMVVKAHWLRDVLAAYAIVIAWFLIFAKFVL